ncbi:toxin Doc [Actinocatenispora thailandica]|uniref:Toxin Doc n=1 Tax=Actinocatenispora thailandica TaxID=227318 RepID=A0A7R7DUK2_9ACTN|nr:type II toxin-antitoxin system death-on-curing family toxin [Actinocatenispora thailandica]BCJ38080.1 toxin Doc [Actinocatenispora thailandica]
MTESVEYLDIEDIVAIASTIAGERIAPRDLGLLASAVARPQASMFGQDAYPDLHVKAAALLHSLAANHAFVDGNKRTALNSAIVFLDINGHPLSKPVDIDAMVKLTLAAAQSQLDLAAIADGLRTFTD